MLRVLKIVNLIFMNVIYMEDTIGLMGEEKAFELIPKGIIKKTEKDIKYLVVNEENL